MVSPPYSEGSNDAAYVTVAVREVSSGTTTLSVFMKGQFIHSDAIAIGGRHITTDIARGLSAGLDDAERLKTMHGSALPSIADERPRPWVAMTTTAPGWVST